ALIDPAGRNLTGPGNAHLEAGGVGQVDNVIGHAELLAPGRLAAGALLVMTALGADDAEVALRQLFHAGETEALAVTLFGKPVAVLAPDLAKGLEADGAPEQVIQGQLLVAQGLSVPDGFAQGTEHLADTALAADQRHQCKVPFAAENSDSSRLAGALEAFLQLCAI